MAVAKNLAGLVSRFFSSTFLDRENMCGCGLLGNDGVVPSIYVDLIGDPSLR